MNLPFSLLLLTHLALASERKFDIKDDIFAYPQYETTISHNDYILQDEAIAKLSSSSSDYTYEELVDNHRAYLCAIPIVHPLNSTEPDDDTRDLDLAGAAARGADLLKEMATGQCLYYTREWWSYAFCYNSHVKQYHALPATAQGVRVWPPPEDESVPSFILGKVIDPKQDEKGLEIRQGGSGELQTLSETNYLVQQLEGGTPCDLTGHKRRIEVQYHCSPGLPDRIGWIRETATCAYRMIIYTSRLCQDVAFQPAKEATVHKIECKEIISEEEEADWRPRPDTTPSIGESDNQQKRIFLGDVEVGAQKIVGKDGRKITWGKIVLTPEERAEIIAMSEGGKIQALTPEEMRRRELDPKEIEQFQRDMQKLAEGRDWKIEKLGEAGGHMQLRGVVSDDEKSEEEDEVEGSEEEFKHEL